MEPMKKFWSCCTCNAASRLTVLKLKQQRPVTKIPKAVQPFLAICIGWKQVIEISAFIYANVFICLAVLVHVKKLSMQFALLSQLNGNLVYGVCSCWGNLKSFISQHKLLISAQSRKTSLLANFSL